MLAWWYAPQLMYSCWPMTPSHHWPMLRSPTSVAGSLPIKKKLVAGGWPANEKLYM